MNKIKPDKFKEILRGRGIKATPACISVIKLLSKTRKPLSAQSIIERLGESHDQATIYRIITKLKEKEIIKPIDLRHNHAHYELVDEDDHHHIICIKCERIEDIKTCEIEEQIYKNVLSQTKNFSNIEEHSLEFYGICKNCEKH